MVQPVCDFLNCFYAAAKFDLALPFLQAYPATATILVDSWILVPRPFQSGNELIQCIVGARALAERAAGTTSSPDIDSLPADPNSIHVMYVFLMH